MRAIYTDLGGHVLVVQCETCSKDVPMGGVTDSEGSKNFRTNNAKHRGIDASHRDAVCNEFLLCLAVLQLCPISSLAASDTPLFYQFLPVSPGLDIFKS